MVSHNRLTNIHRVYNWVHTNAADRQSETVTSNDIGKVSRQTDNNSLWLAIDTTPTWVPISQLLGGELDGYASDQTVAEHYVQLSTAINTIIKDLDAYGIDSSLSEHYRQHSDAIQTILKDLDGYGSLISGLDGTEAEHYAQHSTAIQTIIKELDGYETEAEQRWTDSSQQRQDLRDAADGYASLTTENQRWSDASEQLQNLRDALLDGYAHANTEDEHYRQHSGAIQTILKDLDGYSLTTHNHDTDYAFATTEAEHYTQHSDAIQTILKDLDGYEGGTAALSTVVDEHYSQHSDAIQTILKDLDGYALSGHTHTDYADATTVDEHYTQFGEVVKAITDVVDGYALDSDLTGLDTTVSEHYTQFGGAIKAITDVIDGYSAPPGGVTEATFQSNKGYWNEAIHHLREAADGYAGSASSAVDADGYADQSINPDVDDLHTLGKGDMHGWQWAEVNAHKHRITDVHNILTDAGKDPEAASGNWYTEWFDGNLNRIIGDNTSAFGDDNDDGDPGTTVKVRLPSGPCVWDSNNVMYYMDSQQHAIRSWDANRNCTAAVAGVIASTGDTGDGGAATSAKMNMEYALAYSGYGWSDGYIFFGGAQNDRIRMFQVGANIHPFVGTSTSTAGNTGDGGPAVDAACGAPYGIAVRNNGDVYFADTSYDRIRFVNSASIINHYAGQSDGSSGSADANGTAIASCHFDGPNGIAFDPDFNYLYVSDSGNNCIRRIDLVAETIDVFAGQSGNAGHHDGHRTNLAKFNAPWGVAADGYAVYVAEPGNHTVRRIDLSRDEVSTIVGVVGVSGPDVPNIPLDIDGYGAKLDTPRGVAVGPDGYIYISDTYSYAIRQLESYCVQEFFEDAEAVQGWDPSWGDVSVSYSLEVDDTSDGYESVWKSDGYGGIGDSVGFSVTQEGIGRVGNYTTTQRDLVLKTCNGLIIYNTTDNKLQVYSDGTWTNLH